MSNYQELLQEVVLDSWASAPVLQALTAQVVDQSAEVPSLEDFLAALEDPPEPRVEKGRERTSDAPRLVKGIDYLAREARNQSLGQAGELFIMRFEQARLIHAGKETLADRVTHVSAEEGDGAGFDIHSFETDASDRLIEVKTTAFGKQTPFYVTRNELRVSTERERAYHLYRLFKFRVNPRLFMLPGRLDETCELSPKSYIASVK